MGGDGGEGGRGGRWGVTGVKGYMSRGHIMNVFGKIMTPGTPRKSGLLQREGRNRVKEWREVTFMKAWVKPLYVCCVQT